MEAEERFNVECFVVAVIIGVVIMWAAGALIVAVWAQTAVCFVATIVAYIILTWGDSEGYCPAQ